uniref:C-type lectin domain containing 5A n=2 Tax=Ursus TaxID=9639 RepID=A0A452SQS3_URSAM
MLQAALQSACDPMLPPPGNPILTHKFLQDKTGAEKYFIGLYKQAKNRWRWIDNSIFNGNVTNQHQNFNCVTIGLTKAYDAAPCDISFRWICEKAAI